MSSSLQHWLLVTPARDEAARLPLLAASLRDQDVSPIGLWVIVDDGSVDGTAESVDPATMPFPTVVIQRQRGGGLAVGGAFAAFLQGAEHGLAALPDATHVKKLDADVILTRSYFRRLAEHDARGIIGGVVATGGRDREQLDHVPGFVKGYSRAAFEQVKVLPMSIGLDVIDEPVTRLAGLPVVPVAGAHVVLQRTIGDSEGTTKGRWRNGRVSRWVGYDPVYFLLRVLRYVPRRPAGLGAFVMLRAYLAAGPGPFPAEAKREFRSVQRRKLKALLRNPRGAARELYVPSERCGDERCCA